MPEWITKYWVEWAFGLIVAALTAVVRTLSVRIKKQQQENQALRDGMRSLLRSQIVDTCEACLRDGWCGARKRDTIGDLYASYHALGGNGTVTALVEQTQNLPAIERDQGDRHE